MSAIPIVSPADLKKRQAPCQRVDFLLFVRAKAKTGDCPGRDFSEAGVFNKGARDLQLLRLLPDCQYFFQACGKDDFLRPCRPPTLLDGNRGLKIGLKGGM